MKKSLFTILIGLGLIGFLTAQSVGAWTGGLALGMRAKPADNFSQLMIMDADGSAVSGWVNPKTLTQSLISSDPKGVNKGKLVPAWDLSNVFWSAGSELGANFGGVKKLRVEIYENSEVFVWNAPLDNYAAALNHPIYSQFGKTQVPSLFADRAPIGWTLRYGGDQDVSTRSFGWPANLLFRTDKVYRLRLIASTVVGGQTYSGTVDSLVYPTTGVAVDLFRNDSFGPRLRFGASNLQLTEWPTLYKYTQIVNKDIYDIKIKIKDNNQLAQAAAEQARVRALNAARTQGAVNWIFGHPYFTEANFRVGTVAAKTLINLPVKSLDGRNTQSDITMQLPVAPWMDYESGLATYRLRLMEIKNCNATVGPWTNWLPSQTMPNIYGEYPSDVGLTYATGVLAESEWSAKAGVTTLIDRTTKVSDIPTNYFGPVFRLTLADLQKLSPSFFATEVANRSCAFVGLTALDEAGNQSWDGLAYFLPQTAATQNTQPVANPVSAPNTSASSQMSAAPAANISINVNTGAGSSANSASSWTGSSSAQIYGVNGQLQVNQTQINRFLPATSVNQNNSIPTSASVPASTPVAPIVQSARATSLRPSAPTSTPAVAPTVSSQIPTSAARVAPAASAPAGTGTTLPAYSTGWWKPLYSLINPDPRTSFSQPQSAGLPVPTTNAPTNKYINNFIQQFNPPVTTTNQPLIIPAGTR